MRSGSKIVNAAELYLCAIRSKESFILV